MDRPSKDLSERTLARIVEGLGLAEVQGKEGGPFRRISGLAFPGEVGAARIFRGAGLDKVVTIHLVVPPLGLDSHMLAAFSGVDSALPHFTLDAVAAGDAFSCHLDLLPRVDLAAHRKYMEAVMHPLTPTCEALHVAEGISPIRLNTRLSALLTPWSVVCRATAAGFTRLAPAVDAYLEHWLGLARRGLPAEAMAEIDTDRLAARDARMRASLFDPEIDAVWGRLDRLLGPEVSAGLRRLLKEPGIPAS
jgi:hypothetical protein